MNLMNTEIKKVIAKVKTAQVQLKDALKKQDWVEEARKYAEKQGKEVKKLLNGDISKVKTFIEKERKELERFQKQIPGEMKKIRTFVTGQRKELEKLLTRIRKVNKTKPTTSKKAASKGTGRSKKSASA